MSPLFFTFFLLIGTVTGLTRGVFTVDFSPDNKHVAIAGGDASIRILKIGKEKEKEKEKI